MCDVEAGAIFQIVADPAKLWSLMTLRVSWDDIHSGSEASLGEIHIAVLLVKVRRSKDDVP